MLFARILAPSMASFISDSARHLALGEIRNARLDKEKRAGMILARTRSAIQGSR